MDIESQMKISKIMTEQAEKLGKALSALRRISRLDTGIRGDDLQTATKIANEVLAEISKHGQGSKDL